MKKHAGVVLGLCFSLTLLSVSSVSNAAPQIVGTKCVKVGTFRTAKNVKYQCKKSVKGLRWVTISAKNSPTTITTTTTTTTIPKSPKSVVSAFETYVDINACKLRNRSGQRENLSFDQNPYRVRNTSPIKALIFPIDFVDLVGEGKPSDYLQPIATGISDYFKAMSDGRSDIQWTIHPNFVRYFQPVADAELGGRTTGGYSRFARNATELARATLDISSFQIVLFAPPKTTKRSQIAIGPAFVRDTPEGVNATMLDGQSLDWQKPYLNMAHEILHLMGVSDLYNFNAANEAASGLGGAFELQFVYMGVFDLMNYVGGAGLALTAWNRWLTDLIGDSSMRCLPPTTTRTQLTPVEAEGGIKGAVIPLSQSQAIVIESRRALRYDSQLEKRSEGVLIYKVDTSIGSGSGPMRVIGKPGGDIWHRDAALKVGESRVVDGYTISVIETGTWGDVVEVSAGG